MTPAVLTLTAEPTTTGGLFIKLASDGGYSGPDIDNRFYSIDSQPPDGLIGPHEFWGVVLRDIASCLLTGADEAIIIPQHRNDT